MIWKWRHERREKMAARQEEEAIVHCLQNPDACPTCRSHNATSKVERNDGHLKIRWTCNECGDYWSNFYLNDKWGWYHDRGMRDALHRWAKEATA